MKALRCIIGFCLAAVLWTGLFYAGLFAWGTLFLTPGDSYFDREPAVADAVFNFWIASTVAAGIAAAWWTTRPKKKPQH